MRPPRVVVAASALLLAGCSLTPPAPEPSWVPARPASAPSLAAWQSLRSKLDALRVRTRAARTLKVALTLREPRSGRTLTARGAVALAPPDALRMILLGPGGTTALDLWIHGDAYRFAVPAIDLRKRGDVATPASERRGLPVDFLRFWLLRPGEGELLWGTDEGEATRFLLRDRGALIDLRWFEHQRSERPSSEQRSFEHQRIEARRSVWGAITPGEAAGLVERETVTADGLGCAEVHYHQASTGLEVTVRCEGEEPGAPNPRAFVDPDADEAP